ncbi:hypothetical protein DN752_17890 [Echinicola strongylocentroti]|uniref:Uncharacterized protein n=1 Tax=Echinicola strongylocentroti TaxID=1795355 RepID=A0A2Z4IL67_9BACT|nr:hypothetical protein [Echinicola strongylocentroti]AWW31852.1 hypothetical protein DN752_17890 [Echinicola strongylocentroti]
MERTSLITLLMLADATDYADLTFDNDLPDTGSLTSYFTKIPLVLEKAILQCSSNQSNHGMLVESTVQASTFRESKIHQAFADKEILVYLETTNGEKHFLGSNVNPCTITYSEDSGGAVTDSNDNSLSISHSAAKTA